MGPTLGLSLALWLFHRVLPPVSSVLPLLDSSLLCSLASWLVLGSAFQVLVETWPSSSAGVVSSASSSCLRGPLGCRLLLSTRGLPPCVCFFAGFPGPQAGAVFLSFFRPPCPSVSILCRSGAVFWASCPFGQPWFLFL